MTEAPAFIKRLEKKGLFARVVSISHLGELGAEIKSLHDSDLISDGVYNYTGTEKPYHSPQVPKNLPGVKSVIIVATPQPILVATFHLDGKTYKFEVPPTYYGSLQIIANARKQLENAMKPKKYRFVYARLPQKLLAVRSGLAVYGRTNITYLPKGGSFYRPSAFYSDYESPVDHWQEKTALELCGKCKACRNACPTGAIQKDRFLINAEQCLTFLNEKPSSKGFPKWVKGSAHNSLIGCLRCQKACPYNRDFVKMQVERGHFSEEETRYLLKGKFSGPKAKKMDKKLKRIGLDLTVFPRNLKVLLKNATPE